LAAGTANLALAAGNAASAAVMAGAGRAIYSVYVSVTKGKEHVGITNNIRRRGGEHENGPHSMSIEAIVGSLTKAEARGVEQVMIEARGLQKNGGDLLNQINSIAPSNENYEKLKAKGTEILKSIGYEPKKQ
jgi:hypothetical protein